MQFQQDWPKDKKVTALHKSSTKAVAWTHPQKRCELPLFFAGIQQPVWCWKALDLRRLNMQFQQDWPKDKKLQLFSFLAENKNFARLSLMMRL